MKTKIKYSAVLILGVLLFASCEANFDEINSNPDESTEASSEALFSQAIWNFGYRNFDVWYGGRSSMVAAQQWSQRNYTSEDRYAFRANLNDGIFRNNYIWMNNLQRIINLNKGADTKGIQAALYGDNRMQIACSELVKAWVFQLLTDTYGDVPYSQALNLEKYPQPKYDSQKFIYDDLIKVVGEQADILKTLIAEGVKGYANGDLFYRGDLNKWYRFANSLQLRLALRAASNTLRTSRTLDPAYVKIAESAIERGVFESAADNAQVQFSSKGEPNEAPIYAGFFTSKRNDFTMTRGFVNLVKGLSDPKNEFLNPFEGLVDPRWRVFRGPSIKAEPLSENDKIGIPYGMSDGMTQNFVKANRATVLNYKTSSESDAAIMIRANFPSTFLDYPTVLFMVAEVKNMDAEYFRKGIVESMLQWKADTTGFTVGYLNPIMAKFKGNITHEQKREMVITQKYIHLYMQAFEAWAEYRRTGYPMSLVKPGQVTAEINGNKVVFTPVSGNESGKDIVARFKYPISEYTLNEKNLNAAITAQGGDVSHALRVWWAGGEKQ